MSKKFILLFLGGAIILSFLLYANTLSGEFVYDDDLFTGRQELRDPGYLGKLWIEGYLPENVTAGVWRPLTTFTFALNFILFGESPVSFHVTNIILNGLAVFLAFWLTRKLTGNNVLAVAAGLIFAFLPIHTEAVAYIKSRDEILAAVFIMIAWLWFLREKITLSVLFLLLAVLSKEQAIAAPAMFFLIDMIRAPRTLTKYFRLALPYAIVLASYLFVRFKILGKYSFGHDELYFVSNPLQDADFWTGIWTAFKIAVIYIGKTFFPINLSSTYTYNHLSLVTNPLRSWEALLGMILLGFLAALIIKKSWRNSALGIGAVFFLISYLPISKFVLKGTGEILEEHWMYFPSLGLSIVAAAVWVKLFSARRFIALLLLGLVLGVYAMATVTRNRTWSDPETFYKTMVKTAPNSMRGYLNLAIIYYNQEDRTRALLYADKTKTIYSDHPRLLNLYGRIALRDGDFVTAGQFFEKSLQIRPSLADTHKLYYLALAKQGRYEESLKHVLANLKNHPNDSQLLFLAAVNYYKLGDIQEAQKYFGWNPNLSFNEKLDVLERF